MDRVDVNLDLRSALSYNVTIKGRIHMLIFRDQREAEDFFEDMAALVSVDRVPSR